MKALFSSWTLGRTCHNLAVNPAVIAVACIALAAGCAEAVEYSRPPDPGDECENAYVAARNKWNKRQDGSKYAETAAYSAVYSAASAYLVAKTAETAAIAADAAEIAAFAAEDAEAIAAEVYAATAYAVAARICATAAAVAAE